MGWPPQSLDQNIIEKVWDHLPLSKEEPWKSFKKHGERFLMAFLKKLKETISPFSYNMKNGGWIKTWIFDLDSTLLYTSVYC